MSGTSIDLTESAALAVLRSFLLANLPAGTEVIRGQDNRVAEPTSKAFVVMTTILRVRLGTNYDTYKDNVTSGFKKLQASTQLTVQLDVHGIGPSVGDNAQIISTALRDDIACIAFAASGLAMLPLYVEDPRQVSFPNAEGQYEDRWIVDVAIQINPVVSVAQQFAQVVTVKDFPADIRP